MKKIITLLSLALLPLLPGCATQAHWDAGQLRAYALQYYQDQMIDNLVRGKLGLPFLQVKVDSLQATAEVKGTASFAGGESSVRNGGFMAEAGKLTRNLTSAVTRPLNFGLGGEIRDMVQFNTTPQTDDANSFLLYLKFLLLKNEGQLLSNVRNTHYMVDPASVVSVVEYPESGKPDRALYVPGTLKRFEGRWYYVPVGFQQAYFDLSLALQGSVTWDTPKGATKSSKGNSGPGKAVPLNLPPTRREMFERRFESKIDQLRSLIR